MIKRAFDIVFSLIGCIVFSPLFVVLALLIKLDSRGPVLFRQTRVGRGFRQFSIYKFRTMRQDAEQKGGLLTVGLDPRVTTVGFYLRHLKLDELPQLINVLKGDMSFVGPRPEVPYYVELFKDKYEIILSVRPGITDLASLKYIEEQGILGEATNPEQVYIDTILPEKIALSTTYVQQSSFVFDVVIILETFLRLLGMSSLDLVNILEVLLHKFRPKRPIGGTAKVSPVYNLHTGPLTTYNKKSGFRQKIRKTVRQFIPSGRLFAVKVLLDIIFVIVAVALSFLTYFVISYYWQSEVALNSHLATLYLQPFATFIVPILVLSVASLVLLDVYRPLDRTDQSGQRRKIFAVMSLPPILSAIVVYSFSSDNDPFSPVGMSVLVFGYLAIFLSVPRVSKYYVQSRVVFEVHHHRRERIKRVLVIGGGGYIGSQLCRDLLSRDYKIRILDTFVFGDFPVIDLLSHKNIDVVYGDFRSVEALLRSMRGMDAVIHLGGLVGDPACAIDDDQTLEINLTATMQMAEMCEVLEIERFIFASSCSVYGASGENILTEESPLNPVSLYARTKIASEQILLNTKNQNLTPVILRFGTLFGLSYRPRFDLVVNLLTAQAVKEGKIFVSGGSQWRPFVHVRDVCRSIISVLEAPKNKVNKQIFNVGSNENNFPIIDVGMKILEAVPGTVLEVKEEVDDRRDYNVSFNKLSSMLGLKLEVSVDEGIQELRDALLNGTIQEYRDLRFSNVKQMMKLLDESRKDGYEGDRSGSLGRRPFRQTAKSILNQIKYDVKHSKTGSLTRKGQG